MKPIWNNRREEVEQFLDDGKSSTEIADHYGVTRAVVQKKCSEWKLQIPRKKSFLKERRYPFQDNPQADPFGVASEVNLEIDK